VPRVIDIRGLTKVYNLGEVDVRALDGVDVGVEEGEFIAIMGPSGSGKSTLMNIIGCLDRPTDGTYVLDGADVSSLSRDQRAIIRNAKIGFVFQSFNLLARTSAMENVELPLLYSDLAWSKRQRDDAARESIRRVGLAGREGHYPSQLSGGQQQLVGIARAVIASPKLILADEPTGNLHSEQAREIMELFRELNRGGTTIVQVTHSEENAAYGNRLIRLRDGWQLP